MTYTKVFEGLLSQILHTRLRTGCSALRYYLYNRNLVSDALCQCGTIENNLHFLLECRRYNVMRREMLQTVSRFADVSEGSFYMVIATYQIQIMN